jgi:hypothetical protein
MEVKITMEKFMELIKRTAKLKIGRAATIEESTIAKNNELIYQGTEAMIMETGSIEVPIWSSFTDSLIMMLICGSVSVK